MPDRVRAVTSAQIRDWASKHLTHLQTFVLADDRSLDKELLESFWRRRGAVSVVSGASEGSGFRGAAAAG
jgi:hypothetical protein